MYNKVIEFIRALYQSKDFIPLHAPVFAGNEKLYLEDCIDTTFVSSVGKYVDQLEKIVQEYTGAKKAIATVNGTNALHLALLQVGAGKNDEIITQPFTFIATANAIVYTGAKPVFIDIDRSNLGLSPEKLKDWLSKNAKLVSEGKSTACYNKVTKKKIAAIVPMHTFGHPCRIDEIIKIADEYCIPVVEDAAESLGSFYKNKHTGTYGKLGVLSFNGNKTITTGGGGMILTNDLKLGAHIKHLTTQAKIPHPFEYDHDFIGYNYRMPNLNAALGVAQMENLTKILSSKRLIAQKYKLFFKNQEIQFLDEPEYSKSNFWLNSVILANKTERDAFLKFSNENGVMTRPAWKLMHELQMFKDCISNDIVIAKEISDKLVNLPSSSLIN